MNLLRGILVFEETFKRLLESLKESVYKHQRSLSVVEVLLKKES